MLLIVLLASVVGAQAVARNDTKPTYIESVARVVGGEDAKPYSWPWQVTLQYLYRGSYSHFCGGSLIKKGWVMTAAHCVDTPRTFRVVLGEHNFNILEGKEQYRNVSQVFVHPEWQRFGASNGFDIALLRLSTDAPINPNIKTALLLPADNILPKDNTCYVTGWGQTEVGKTSVLKQAYLPVVDHPTCSQTDWWNGHVKKHMACAGGRRSSGCFGDSGGPLNCLVNGQYYVYGITSFGPPRCGTEKKPTVFTRVTAFVMWMQGIMEQYKEP